MGVAGWLSKSLVLKTSLFFITARGMLFVVFSGLERGVVREFSILV